MTSKVTTVTEITKKLRQLEGSELQAAAAWLDQLVAARRKQKPVYDILENELVSLVKLKEELERENANVEVAVDLAVKIDFVLFCDPLEEDIPVEISLGDIRIQGKDRLAQDIASLMTWEDDYQIADCLLDNLGRIKLDPAAKAFKQKTANYRNAVDKLSKKYKIDGHVVLDQLSDFVRHQRQVQK